MTRRITAVLAGLLLAAPVGQVPLAGASFGGGEAYAQSCNRCGCRGGPGWRIKRNGRCAGWKDMERECGAPPDPDRCTKEG